MRRSVIVSGLILVSAGCSSSSGAPAPTETPAQDAAPSLEDAAPAADAASRPVVAGVLVVGTLAGSDLAASEAAHNGLAQGAQAAANEAGDVAHTVMLGTTILGTAQNQFLALDRWTNATAEDAFYSNPQFLAAFGKLFSAAPSVTIYLAQPAWVSYGSPDSANATDPHYWVIVRGKLASADMTTNQATHDAIVGEAKAQAMAAGDMAHTVWTGAADGTEFLAIDVWAESTNIASFYGNAQLQAGFAKLFSGAPTIGIYESTSWYQWGG